MKEIQDQKLVTCPSTTTESNTERKNITHHTDELRHNNRYTDSNFKTDQTITDEEERASQKILETPSADVPFYMRRDHKVSEY